MTKEIRKAIILAGGTGSRLFPITKSVCKQLLPIYDKPMIYYPLSTLMSSGIKDILIITSPKDKPLFEKLLNDGSQFGINISYCIQGKPNGIAEAFILGEEFINNGPITLILGDNIFHGDEIANQIRQSLDKNSGATLFAYRVKDPERYGVAEFNQKNKVISIEEKPKKPKSNYAITGIYCFDHTIVHKAKEITPSQRGELEITDINMMYLKENNLTLKILKRGSAWLDTGNTDSLHEASAYIRTLEHRQGLKVGCPEEIAWKMGWINESELMQLANQLKKSGYGEYLLTLPKHAKN